MAKSGVRVPVRRGDHERVLITETLPFETPLIFSGDNFYSRMKEYEASQGVQKALADVLVLRRGPKPPAVTIPFAYKIRKGVAEFRKLSVIHPSSLWEVGRFYKEHAEWLLYLCSLSPMTIRAPEKISGSFYERNESDAVNQYKKGQVLAADSVTHSRYNPSYFSYRGFNRLYKFFSSEEFTRLEQRYGLLKTLDTSRCFDSIYTHSVTWATMGKAIAKDARKLATRADDFDKLMQNINHGETNGIVIGPEVSRIFAEVIFQRIDVTAKGKLHQLSLEFGRDYEIYRYVDDVFIFANSNATIQTVYESYTDAMAQYNLYSNPHKSLELPRPFVTHKSEVIESAKRFIDQLGRDLFQEEVSARSALRPKLNLHADKTVGKLIASLRSICFASSANYADLSSYIISACCERIKRFVKRKTVSTTEQQDYRNVASILAKLMFFLYTVAPTVNASFRFATGIILLLRFSDKWLTPVKGELAQLIFSEVCVFLDAEAQRRTKSLSNFVSLEALNVLILAKELSATFLIPLPTIERLFVAGSCTAKLMADWCYFDLMACAYYIGNQLQYAPLRDSIEAEVDSRLSDMTGVDQNAEKAYLLLDSLSCPYFDPLKKRGWLTAFQQKFSLPSFTPAEFTAFLASVGDRPWFTGWGHVDLLTLLQKKELVPSY